MRCRSWTRRSKPIVRALDVDERDTVSLDALTDLYRQRGRFPELAELYLRRAENEEDIEKGCAFRLALARLQRDEIKDMDAAIDQYEEIVRRSPAHKEAVTDLEDLMSDEGHKARIVDILLPIYEGADDWRKLIYLNAQRFELASEDMDRVAILKETARLWEERGGDHRRAFDALRAAFEIDTEDSQLRGGVGEVGGEAGSVGRPGRGVRGRGSKTQSLT